MVFIQQSSSPGRGKTSLDYENQSKKRKREETIQVGRKPVLDMDLHLESFPLPAVSPRLLDIQSGKIHFNKAKRRTFKDPSNRDHMNLDLELNLPCSLPCSSTKKEHADHYPQLRLDLNYTVKPSRDMQKNSGELICKPSWLACDGDNHQEMMAAVCMQCHLLVMLCKSSPACPNCKFVHPPDHQSSVSLFERNCNHLC